MNSAFDIKQTMGRFSRRCRPKTHQDNMSLKCMQPRRMFHQGLSVETSIEGPWFKSKSTKINIKISSKKQNEAIRKNASILHGRVLIVHQ